MDEKRLEELSKKRFESGLSEDEADELGRLFAEKDGKPYSNAKLSKLPPGERGADVPVADESAGPDADSEPNPADQPGTRPATAPGDPASTS